MTNPRPVNLDLFSIHFPITAIASILHRITAVIVFVGWGFLIATLMTASASEAGFLESQQMLHTNFLVQFIAWGLGTATGYYFAATAKHIIQDLGFCETFKGGQVISWVAIVSGLAISVFLGVLIWA